jgi:hypothetical protein
MLGPFSPSGLLSPVSMEPRVYSPYVRHLKNIFEITRGVTTWSCFNLGDKVIDFLNHLFNKIWKVSYKAKR